MIKIGKHTSEWMTYKYQPKTKKELKEIILYRISKNGTNCNLNDIDVSLITNMSYLFYCLDFTGDISEWNVGNVTDMECMFADSKFNGDISEWDTSNVKNMFDMFAYSEFNQPIGNWNVSNVKNMDSMFIMTQFNSDISKWNINKDCCTLNMFDKCPIKEEYKPKLSQ